MRAYYFSANDKKLSYGDNRLIEKGITHTVEGEIKLCKWGLHASEKLLDALQYAPGTILWIVELNGEIIKGDDKCVASSRTYIKGGYDIEPVLKEFARKVALINIEKIKPYCSSEDYRVIYNFLITGDDSVADAAWSAADAAACAAACAAARSAARAAWSAWSADYAIYAARSAAWSAAYAAYAACAAARSAAYGADVAACAADVAAYAAYAARSADAAAYDDEYNTINKMLEEMVEKFICSQNS